MDFIEIILLWVSVGCYVASSAMFILSLTFKKEKALNWAALTAFIGLLPHSASLLMRWIQSGHGPYVTFYEITASDSWMVVFVFLLFQLRYHKLRVLGVLIMPVSFLLIGLGVMSSPEIQGIPPTFRTYWLIVHIFFAKLAFGPILIAAGLSIFYLFKTRVQQVAQNKILTLLPEPAVLDELSYKFMGFGFISLTIMIAAGSIWAQYSWGRYWGWDPIEVWSLISWFLCSLYLHFRLFAGWRGKRSAWMCLLVLLVLLFSMFGVVYLYHSVHSSYLT